jgi:thiol-disulfide isomerase/thioredoxin
MVAVIVVGLLVLSLWQASQLRGSSSRAGSPTFGTGTTLYPGDDGIPLPKLEGPTLGKGTTLSLGDQLGHVVVINVWGSWCGPCRAEAPDLAAISQEAARRGVRFLGIDVRDDPAAALKFERTYGITYPSFDDRDGSLLAKLSGIVPVGAVPSTIVVDEAGVVRARVIGRVDGPTLRSLIADTEKTP